MIESLFIVVAMIFIYTWTMFIGRKAVDLSVSDPERKSSAWAVFEIINIVILFSILLGPILVFDVKVVQYMLLACVPILLQLYLFNKYFRSALKRPHSENKNV